jgi:hypothetical protein
MWTKYSYLCTSCDALIEITAQVDPQYGPACFCDYQTELVLVGTEDGNALRNDVIEVTPSEVVKINTNPYN